MTRNIPKLFCKSRVSLLCGIHRRFLSSYKITSSTSVVSKEEGQVMSKVYLIPVAVFLIFQVTFLGTYIAAVLQGHVVPTIPYISDAATYSPESCVFGQMINIGSDLLGITIYIRYRQILQLFEHHSDLDSNMLRYNRRAVWFGLASCLGISIVGNFQETNVRVVNLIAAFCCFGFGTLYFWMQALVSYMVYPIAGTKRNAHLRLGMSVCCTTLFIMMAVTGISEWVIATIFSFYILTFTDEFRDVDLDHPPLRLISYSLTLQ